MDKSIEKCSGIYEILNLVNGKRYVGSSEKINQRWWKHRKELKRGRHHSPILQAAWNKHGAQAFKFRVVLTCAKSMLLFYEQQLLNKVKPEYNIATIAGAAMLGKKHSEATKAKMSFAQTGRKRSPETCARLSAALMGNTCSKGRVLSDEHRARLSEINKGNPGVPGNKNGLGYKHTPEAKLRIAAACRGRIRSAEAKAKTAWGMLGNTNGAGHKLTLEHIAKLTAARRAARAKREEAPHAD